MRFKVPAASALFMATFASLSAADAEAPAGGNPQSGEKVAAREAPSLNHVYIVLDRATFSAIRKNRELARLLGRTDGGLPDHAPPPPDADRIFFRGRHTYLELFAPDNRFREPVGKVGIALGHDQVERFEGLAAKWKDACGPRFRRTPVTYSRRQPAVPWYDAIQCDDTASGPQLALWAMVYRPDFQRWQSGGDDSTPARIARADILALRRGQGQGRFDITALSLKVSPALYLQLARQLETAGMARNGAQFSGEGWTLTLEVHEAPGLSSMSFTTDAAPVQNQRLGGAVLTREGTHRIRLQLGKRSR